MASEQSSDNSDFSGRQVHWTVLMQHLSMLVKHRSCGVMNLPHTMGRIEPGVIAASQYLLWQGRDLLFPHIKTWFFSIQRALLLVCYTREDVHCRRMPCRHQRNKIYSRKWSKLLSFRVPNSTKSTCACVGMDINTDTKKKHSENCIFKNKKNYQLLILQNPIYCTENTHI